MAIRVNTRNAGTEAFIRKLRKHPVLGREEERRLATLYRETGDRGAARRLVEGHLRLVVRIARSCCFQTSALSDVIQEGTLGLMKAVTKYDPNRGFRLSTYAEWWIRAAIYQHNMVNGRIVRIVTTVPQRKLFFALRREQARLSATGSPSDPRTLAKRLGVPERDLVQMEQRLGAKDTTIDGSMPDTSARFGAHAAEEALPPDEAFAAEELRRAIAHQIRALDSSLDERERLILERRLTADDPMTLQDIGRQFGISRERARQLEERLKKLLRRHLTPFAGEHARAA